MIDPVQNLYDASLEAHKAGDLIKALQGYYGLLNRNPYDATLLYLIGNVYLQQHKNGVAINLLESALRNNDQLEGAWNDLGCALKAEHYDDAAAKAWEKAIELGGRTAGTINNLATLYADSGYPEKALPLVEEALRLDPENPHVRWNRALALLSLGRWSEAWPEHEYRKMVNTTSVGKREYGPEWKGEADGLLIVHGEQGLGDEVMFATILHDLLTEHPNTIIECEKKLVPLFARSFGRPTFATPEEVAASGLKPDYQIGFGSLGLRYRMSVLGFLRECNFMVADPELVEEARDLVKDLPRPLIGVSWMGGTKTTRVQHRSLSAKAMVEMCGGIGTPISLQYGEYSDVEADAAGLLRFGAWTDGKDLDKLAAMIVVMDEIVSVCTTLIHLTGALGREAHILTPLRASWRYGMGSGKGAMLWYPQHTLHRQTIAGDWEPVVDGITKMLKEKYA